MALVGIIMGSDSDVSIMKEAAQVLSELKVPYEATVASAHRTPDRASEWARTAAARGLKVIIAGAGAASPSARCAGGLHHSADYRRAD